MFPAALGGVTAICFEQHVLTIGDCRGGNTDVTQPVFGMCLSPQTNSCVARYTIIAAFGRAAGMRIVQIIGRNGAGSPGHAIDHVVPVLRTCGAVDLDMIAGQVALPEGNVLVLPGGPSFASRGR